MELQVVVLLALFVLVLFFLLILVLVVAVLLLLLVLHHLIRAQNVGKKTQKVPKVPSETLVKHLTASGPAWFCCASATAKHHLSSCLCDMAKILHNIYIYII